MPTGLKQLIGIVVVVVAAMGVGWAWTRTLPMVNPHLPVVVEAAMVDDGGYGIYAWDGGVQVVLIYEGALADSSCAVTPAGGAPNEVYRCTITFVNGTIAEWSIRTADGKTGTITVEGRAYRMSRDADIVRIVADGGSPQVTTYARMMPPLTIGKPRDIVTQWMARDPELAPFAAVFRSQ